MEKNTIILGIETSCDETAVAVVKNGTEIIANVVASQIESHKRFGGVVPEIASRHHVEEITVVLEEALKEANITFDDIDAIAVTEGPGLVGALLIGVNAAKAVAFAHDIPPSWCSSYRWPHLCEPLSKRSSIPITITCCIWWTYRACLYERTWFI